MFENFIFFIRQHKRIINIILAVFIAVFLFTYLSKNIDFKLVSSILAKTPFYVFIVACIGTILNWGLEAKKWHFLINSIEKTSFFRAQSAVYAGVAVSNIFPFKIGEYLGKLYFVERENHIKSMGLSFVSSIAQMLLNLSLSITPAIIMVGASTIKNNFSGFKLFGIFIIIVLVILIFNKWGKKHKLIQDFKAGLAHLKGKQVAMLIVFSFLRFAAFASAYVFVLHYYLPYPVHYIYLGVGAIYFLQSFSPGMAATDASVRLALPLIIFGTAKTLKNEIETAAIINYVFSVLTPSLLGLAIITYQSFLKRRKKTHTLTEE